jgi:hypothetical protein
MKFAFVHVPMGYKEEASGKDPSYRLQYNGP